MHPLLESHPILPLLAEHLRNRPGIPAADDGNPARAAVAIVLRATGSAPDHPGGPPHLPFPISHLDVLLIQRAERDGDPWSGQVALPGGRRHRDDATLQDTAIRETLEETGIDLGAHGLILGTLDELRPRTPVLPPIIVTPFVALAPYEVGLQPSDEVAEAFWSPWSAFSDPDFSTESTVLVRGAEWRVSSYVLGHRVVWGMTERMLRQLAERMREVGGRV